MTRKPWLLACWAVLGTLALPASARDLPIETQPALDQSNNIRNHLMRVAGELSHNSLAGVHTCQQWERVRPRRYQEYLEMKGLVDLPVDGERPR